MREMDEEEFEKVMRNAEKVLERSPVYKHYSQAGEDFEVKKFSQEEYVMQGEWYEEHRSDFLDALSPIISPEIMEEISGLMNEFQAVYGSADMDTTGYRAIMQKASQDALAYEAGSCSNPQQITVNQASILPLPSMATIMGRFWGNGPCKSCCIECCGCANACESGGWKRFGDAFWTALSVFGTCYGYAWYTGTLSLGGCSFAAIVGYDIAMIRAIWYQFTCDKNCRKNPACVQCPAGIDEWWPGTDCSTADRW